MDLYATKAATLARLDPLIDRLAASGVSPDQLTLAAIPVAVIAGACLLASTAVPALLVLIPFLAATRLVLNLLDGAVARRTGRIHPRGELFNEVGDRICDVAFLAPVAFLPGAETTVVLLGVIGALVASYIGIVAKAAGGERIYRGVLSKPGRMVLLSACAIAALLVGSVAWTVFGVLLLVGTWLTALERMVVAIRRLP
jgi:CDP-diacylglycerol---glycerol-3-phosphate 3-phosphatidyltransferase